MEEAKTKNTKQTALKNKKAVKQSLAKASIKGKTTKKTTKTAKKPTTVKKKIPSNIIKPVKETEKKVLTEEKVVKEQLKKTRVVKAPNNIKRKLPPPGKVKKVKEEVKEEIKEKVIEQSDTSSKSEFERLEKELEIITNKEKEQQQEKNRIQEEKNKLREEKKKKKEEAKRKKQEAKRKKKEARKLEKEKARKEKKKQKEENKKKKTKIELPKEWKTINKNNVKFEKNKTEEKPKTFKGKLRSSIFESVDEKELEERKRKSRDSLKKTLIVLLILAITIGLIIYSLLKYNDFVKKQLAVYEPYRIGDKVKLNNESVWYVVNDSDSKNDSVRLLATFAVDVNNDGVVDGNDFVRYNTKNVAEYDVSDENSVANLLNGPIKERYEQSIGKIEELNLLTSKEFVKIRERMNFGDQWDTGNWLAHMNFQRWWIQSEQNNKVYVVSGTGTFFLIEPNSSHLIRPAVTIKKEYVTKIEEKKTITVDLINGLKRK